jgi:hypothetical protein
MTNCKQLRNGTRLTTLGFLALACMLLPACSQSKEEDVQLTPVAGKVTIDGKIMPMGTVIFHPDEAKGNKSTKTINGHIQEDGSYKLIYVTASGPKDGAPVGWYKVSVNVGPPTNDAQSKMKVDPYNQDFKSPKTTKLLIEVKAGAGADAYDIKLKK